MYFVFLKGIRRKDPNRMSQKKLTEQSPKRKVGPNPSDKSSVIDMDSLATRRFNHIRVNITVNNLFHQISWVFLLNLLHIIIC